MFRRLLLLPLLFAVTACGQATPPLTASPTATTSPTLPATLTALPTATATVTPTSLPPLSGKKPYWMVKTDSNNQAQMFSIYDTNGGRKVVELPPDGHVKSRDRSLNTFVSPDGQWLVFYTGSTHYLDSETKLPVTLKLLNLADGTIRTVADVVTDGYKEKLAQLADQVKELSPDYYKPIDTPTGSSDWVSDGLAEVLERGIYTIAWSPDGHTLAFAAQIDGLSSDVYLYDMETGAIQQVEDSIQSVTGIRWSLDGKKILFENSYPAPYGRIGPSNLYVVNAQKTTVKDPEPMAGQTWIGSFDLYTQTWSPTGDWLSPNLLLLTGQTPEAGPSGIDALNINTGQSTTLWGSIFGSYVIDQKNKTILVSPSDYTDPKNLGVYFITSTGRRTKVFDGIYYLDLFFRGGEKNRFLIQGVGGNQAAAKYPMAGDVVGLSLDGKPTFLGKFSYKNISISPDYASLLMWDDDKLSLYDKNDELLKTFPIPGITRVIWRPDSQGIFYATDKDLYTLSLPDGTPTWIDSVSIYDATWLP